MIKPPSPGEPHLSALQPPLLQVLGKFLLLGTEAVQANTQVGDVHLVTSHLRAWNTNTSYLMYLYRRVRPPWSRVSPTRLDSRSALLSASSILTLISASSWAALVTSVRTAARSNFSCWLGLKQSGDSSPVLAE